MTPSQLAWRAEHYVPWYERIGDGGLVAWVITAAYFLAAWLCWRAGRRQPRSARKRARLWLAAGFALLALGINKQLDLQVGLVEFWRETALDQGWYGARRTVQFAAFAFALAATVGAAAWLLPTIRASGRALRWAFAGMVLIASYIILRLAEFQHLVWDSPEPKGPGWLALVELGGIAIVAAAASLAATRRGRTH